MHEVKPKSYSLQPEKYVWDFKNFLLVTNYQQFSKDGRTTPPPQILEISLVQRKATALTLLGSGKLFETEKKCSFITGGQRKSVLCPWENFHPSERSGQSFLWISELELREPEQGAGGTQRATTPEQKPLEKTGDSTREMPVLRTQRTKDCQTLPSLSCDLSLSLSAHFTSYTNFGSSGEEGRGST